MRYLLIFLILSSMVSAVNLKSEEGRFQIVAPDVVPRTGPFEVQIKAKSMDANFIDVSRCNIMNSKMSEEAKSNLPPIGVRSYTEYDGDKEFTLKLTTYPFSDDKNNERTCKIKFINRKEGGSTSFTFAKEVDKIEFDFKVADVKINNPIPGPFSKTSIPEELKFYPDSSSKNRFSIFTTSYPYSIDGVKWDWNNPDFALLYLDKADYDKKEFEKLNNIPIYYSITSSSYVKSDDEKTKVISAEIFAQRYYPHFYITFDLSVTEEVAIENADAALESAKTSLLTYVKDFQISESGVVSASDDFVDEDVDGCKKDSDCGNGNLKCNACGKCVKKVIDLKDAKLEIELENKQSAKSINNNVFEWVKIVTNVKPKISANGKNVDYCDLAAPGFQNLELVAKMKNQDGFAGFRSISLFDRKDEEKWPIDFAKEDYDYFFRVAPSDKKKVLGVVGDIVEPIEISVEGYAKSEISVTLKPSNLDIDISSNGVELQQGTNKLVNFVVKAPKSKSILMKSSLVGPGEMELDGIKAKKVYANFAPGTKKKIMYYAPELGNFDIGKELASLSMVDLQKEAAKQIAEDVALAYAGDYFQGAEDAYKSGDALKFEQAGMKAIRNYFKNNPGKYSPEKALKYIKQLNAAKNEAKNLDLVAKGFKAYSGTYGLSKIPKGTVDLRDEMKAAASTETNSNKKTWTESAAEYGVVGIDILQTGVGIITFVPNKIPLVNKASAGVKSAFSAMTNIWKANLKYIAKDEKIARAKEKFFPVVMIVTAEDESGWIVTKGYMLQVAYHEI